MATTLARHPLPQDHLAQRLQAVTDGLWLVWYGRHTRRFWAMSALPDLSLLIDAETPEHLATAMSEIDTYYGPLPTSRRNQRQR